MGQEYGEEFLDKLTERNPLLSELIEVIPLVVTPDEKGEWLYGEADFRDWLEEYKRESSFIEKDT